MIFLAGLTILKKERWLGIVSGLGVDPVVALHLKALEVDVGLIPWLHST